jgi:3-phytase
MRLNWQSTDARPSGGVRPPLESPAMSMCGKAGRVSVVIATLASCVACRQASPTVQTSGQTAAPPGASAPAAAAVSGVAPALATDPVAHDPDDPAIWRHPSDPGRSLILGTDKVAGVGALYVFGLDGKVRQTLGPLDRPNNVDVEYGVRFGARTVDVAVVTERKQHRLRVFAIPADGGALSDLAPRGLPVLEGMTGAQSEPMGVALYKRPRDGAVFAIVAPKSGSDRDYLWQYRFDAGPDGAPRLTRVRRFGAFSGIGPEPGEAGEIEAVVVDDELGFVYYSDERFGIRKWAADPDDSAAAAELAVFGRDGYLGDREGLAIYPTGPGRGFIVSSDQIEGATRVRLYPREGIGLSPHVHEPTATIVTQSDETDGLEALAAPLPGFPQGLLVMMNSSAKNFLIYQWAEIATSVGNSRQVYPAQR